MKTLFAALTLSTLALAGCSTSEIDGQQPTRSSEGRIEEEKSTQSTKASSSKKSAQAIAYDDAAFDPELGMEEGDKAFLLDDGSALVVAEPGEGDDSEEVTAEAIESERPMGVCRRLSRRVNGPDLKLAVETDRYKLAFTREDGVPTCELQVKSQGSNLLGKWLDKIIATSPNGLVATTVKGNTVTAVDGNAVVTNPQGAPVAVATQDGAIAANAEQGTIGQVTKDGALAVDAVTGAPTGFWVPGQGAMYLCDASGKRNKNGGHTCIWYAGQPAPLIL